MAFYISNQQKPPRSPSQIWMKLTIVHPLYVQRKTAKWISNISSSFENIQYLVEHVFQQITL